MKNHHLSLNISRLAGGFFLSAWLLTSGQAAWAQGSTVYHWDDGGHYLLVPMPSGELLRFDATSPPGSFYQHRASGTWWIHHFLNDAEVTMLANGAAYLGHGHIQMASTANVVVDAEGNPVSSWTDFQHLTLHFQAWLFDVDGGAYRVKGHAVFRPGKLPKIDFTFAAL